jgi:hypothetical protein
MTIFSSQHEVDSFLNDDGDLVLFGDVQFNCDIKVQGAIEVVNLNAQDVMANSISANDISAFCIFCESMVARDVNALRISCELILTAQDIKVGHVLTGSLHARRINADTILAEEINADEIVYDAVAIAFASFKCRSIAGQRKNAVHLCLDGNIEILTT